MSIRTLLTGMILGIAVIGLICPIAGAQELAKDQVLKIAFDAGDAKNLDPHRATTTVDPFHLAQAKHLRQPVQRQFLEQVEGSLHVALG